MKRTLWRRRGRKPLVLSPMRMWKPNWKRKKAADEIKQEDGWSGNGCGWQVCQRVSMDDRTKNALIEETLAEIGENTWLS